MEIEQCSQKVDCFFSTVFHDGMLSSRIALVTVQHITTYCREAVKNSVSMGKILC